MPRVEYEMLVEPTQAETSAKVRDRIEQSRKLQHKRFDGTGIFTNAEMGPVEVWDSCKLDESAQALLHAAMKQMHLSARSFHRVLKISRTIADLATADTISVAHMAEALQSGRRGGAKGPAASTARETGGSGRRLQNEQ